MIKEKVKLAFIVLRFFLDTLCIPTAFVIGYALKFKLYLFGIPMHINPNAQIENYFSVLGYIMVIWLLAFMTTGMYRLYTGPIARLQESFAVVRGVIIGTVSLMAFTFLYPVMPDSRFVVAYAAIAAIGLLICVRLLLGELKNLAHRFGYGSRRTLIVGSSITAQRLAERILRYPELGFTLIGFLYQKKPAQIIHPLRNAFNKLGSPDQLFSIIKRNTIQAVFYADQIDLEKAHHIADSCREKGVYFRVVAAEYARTVTFDTLDSIPLIDIRVLTIRRWQRVLKRIFDLVCVIPLLLITSPLMIIIALLVKLSSPGPVLHRQVRVTRGGKEFNFIKFRSMPHNVEQGKPVISTKDQKHRTTFVGYWLRKTSLDELPQLFNVLLGDMSIVGPRPERPHFHEQFCQKIPAWTDRLAVKGGITGWAQINGRAVLSSLPEEKLDYDLYYIQNWSILFDLKIMLRTIGYVLMQKNAY